MFVQNRREKKHANGRQGRIQGAWGASVQGSDGNCFCVDVFTLKCMYREWGPTPNVCWRMVRNVVKAVHDVLARVGYRHKDCSLCVNFYGSFPLRLFLAAGGGGDLSPV